MSDKSHYVNLEIEVRMERSGRVETGRGSDIGHRPPPLADRGEELTTLLQLTVKFGFSVLPQRRK